MLVDISVPRNVHGNVQQFQAFNVDDLKGGSGANYESRRKMAMEAEGLLGKGKRLVVAIRNCLHDQLPAQQSGSYS